MQRNGMVRLVLKAGLAGPSVLSISISLHPNFAAFSMAQIMPTNLTAFRETFDEFPGVRRFYHAQFHNFYRSPQEMDMH